MLTPNSDAYCTCGLRWRIALRTEQEMHKAWRKRAEEAEAALDIERKRAEAAEGERDDWMQRWREVCERS